MYKPIAEQRPKSKKRIEPNCPKKEWGLGRC